MILDAAEVDLNADLKLLLPDTQLQSLNLPLLLSICIFLVGEILDDKKKRRTRSDKRVKLPTSLSILFWGWE